MQISDNQVTRFLRVLLLLVIFNFTLFLLVCLNLFTLWGHWIIPDHVRISALVEMVLPNHYWWTHFYCHTVPSYIPSLIAPWHFFVVLYLQNFLLNVFCKCDVVTFYFKYFTEENVHLSLSLSFLHLIFLCLGIYFFKWLY